MRRLALLAAFGVALQTACGSATPGPVLSPTARPLAIAAPAVHDAIQGVLDEAARAWREHDQAAFEALLDPQASDAWRANELDRFRSVAVPRPDSLHAERIMLTGEWALALVSVPRAIRSRHFIICTTLARPAGN